MSEKHIVSAEPDPVAMLQCWIASIDSLVGDTTTEIEKRREQNIRGVALRSDLQELVSFIRDTELPPAVYRGLVSCLAWNPFSRPRP